MVSYVGPCAVARGLAGNSPRFAQADPGLAMRLEAAKQEANDRQQQQFQLKAERQAIAREKELDASMKRLSKILGGKWVFTRNGDNYTLLDVLKVAQDAMSVYDEGPSYIEGRRTKFHSPHTVIRAFPEDVTSQVWRAMDKLKAEGLIWYGNSEIAYYYSVPVLEFKDLGKKALVAFPVSPTPSPATRLGNMLRRIRG